MWRGQVESVLGGIVSVFYILFLYGFIELQDKHALYKIQNEKKSAKGTFYLTPPHIFINSKAVRE
jgi:hypothetical protein